jgi:AcrR family transcriptional regulator
MTVDNNKHHAPTVSEIRRERERIEMAERIMDVAREMFVRDGYEAVTLRKIAQVIEYSPAVIYQYFRDKQALVKAIIQKDQQDLHAHILTCMQMEDPRERLVEMARRYAYWGITHPNHYMLLLTPPTGWTEHKDELREHEPIPLDQEALVILYETVKDAIQRGVLKEKYADPSFVAATLWAGIHGVIMLEITMNSNDWACIGNPEITFENRFATLTEVFLDGFLRE